MKHWAWDIVFLLVYSAGQFLFLLRRADLARRSPLNGLNSIWQFFRQNWVVLLIRCVVFEDSLLYLYRHPDFLAMFGVNVHLYHFPQSLMLTFFGGFFADTAVDYITGLDKVPVVGWVIPKKVKEQIPQLPEVQQLVSTLESKP